MANRTKPRTPQLRSGDPGWPALADAWNAAHAVGTLVAWSTSPRRCSGETTGPARMTGNDGRDAGLVGQLVACVPVELVLRTTRSQQTRFPTLVRLDGLIDHPGPSPIAEWRAYREEVESGRREPGDTSGITSKIGREAKRVAEADPEWRKLMAAWRGRPVRRSA